MPPPRNLYKITLPPHMNQAMEVTFMPAFRGPVVSLVYRSLHFLTLARKYTSDYMNIHCPQLLQVLAVA